MYLIVLLPFLVIVITVIITMIMTLLLASLFAFLAHLGFKSFSKEKQTLKEILFNKVNPIVFTISLIISIVIIWKLWGYLVSISF